MNKLTLLAAAAAALSTSVVFASAPATAPCGNCSKPVPVHIVNPTELPADAVNTTVDMVMEIDAQGVPHQVHTLHYVDRRIAQSLKTAVSQWRFKPEVVNGQAVATRVVLPVSLGAENNHAAPEGLASAPATTAN